VDTDPSQTPVEMIVNSIPLCVIDFDLREVIPLQLEVMSRGGRCTHGTTLKQIHGMGTRTYVLSMDNDNEFRSRVTEYQLDTSGLQPMFCTCL